MFIQSSGLKLSYKLNMKSILCLLKLLGNQVLPVLRKMTEFIVNDKWFSERKKDSNDEAEKIIVTAAKLIPNNIRSAKFSCEFYPTRKDVESCEKGKEWLPNYLKSFLENILKYALKQASIDQAIINATRPRPAFHQFHLVLV